MWFYKGRFPPMHPSFQITWIIPSCTRIFERTCVVFDFNHIKDILEIEALIAMMRLSSITFNVQRLNLIFSERVFFGNLVTCYSRVINCSVDSNKLLFSIVIRILCSCLLLTDKTISQFTVISIFTILRLRLESHQPISRPFAFFLFLEIQN